MESGGQSATSEHDQRAFARGEALLRAGEVDRAAETFRTVRRLETLLAQKAPDGRTVAGPDFLIIGAPRGGTSWLKRALKHHPDVFLPPGEPHYFGRGLDRPPAAYVTELARHVRADSPRPIVGEKSPAYLTMSDDRIALCAALFPRLKLICHVREPIARAWSMIRRLRLFEADAADALDVAASDAPVYVAETFHRGEPWDLPALRRVLDRPRRDEGDLQGSSLKARVRLAAWRLILESSAGHVEAHGRLAALMAASEHPEEAIPHLKALTRLAPDDPAHWRDLAKRLQDLGDGPRTIAAWTGLLAISPGDLQAHANLARLHAGQGQHGQAAIHFRVEAGARPGDAKTWRRLAACLGHAGDLAGELDALTRALEIDRSQAEVKARAAALRRRLKHRAV